MPALLFKHNEQAYLDWLGAHPHGFIVTTHFAVRPDYLVLHRPNCTFISEYRANTSFGGFTSNGYLKVASESIQDLLLWIRPYGATTFSKLCKRCCKGLEVPEETSPGNEGASAVEAFETAVARSRRDSPAARRARLEAAKDLPPRYEQVTSMVRVRDPDVVAEVLDRAGGICEECKSPAPFKRRSNQTPYLEVHHDIQLADLGPDTVENARALCPNCHRRLHFG